LPGATAIQSKNVLIHAGRVVLLDHEVIHFGEPAFDLGFSLTHLLSKAHYLRAQRRSFVSAAHLYWRSYLQAVAPFHQTADFESRVVRHTLACCWPESPGAPSSNTSAPTIIELNRKSFFN